MSAGFSLHVPGAPVAWQRARRQGKRYFTDPKVSAHQARIRDAWVLAGSPNLGSAALAVRATFWLPRPRSHCGTGRNAQQLRTAAPLLPTGKPDLDNLVKILDALNGLAWTDDAQLVRMAELEKLYAPPGEGGGSTFYVWSLANQNP